VDTTDSRDLIRAGTAAIAVVALAAVAGCGGQAERAATPALRTGQVAVVSHEGLAGIEFGDPRAELEREHGLTEQPGDCAPRLPSYPSVSPVFEDGRLVLLWAEPPLRTPAGIAVGMPIARVREAHPEAVELTAPLGSYRYDGLLAATGDRAYLYLHDGISVQKLIVGYAEHCQRLFHEGFGVC
jgi:hypothetical protein